MKKLPIVAIVGRANVGKSSLFNRVLQEPRAVTAKEAGTTRDAISEIVNYKQQAFWLVDTAGLKNPEDDFEATIQDQITEAIDTADLIVVVIEAASGQNDEDRHVAKQALKSKKPVVLCVNKVDQVKDYSSEDYNKLGIRAIISTSATQNQGIDDLLDAITETIPETTPLKKEDSITITLIGRPNAGKSHLFNTLAKKQQAIVADVAGTTRDINKVRVRYHEQAFDIFDTAGLRRPGRIERGVEQFSILRTTWAIREADICLLLMDANEHSTKLDQRIAGMIKEAGKGLVLVISKWDSIDKDAYTADALLHEVKRNFPFIPWAPLILTSSVTGQNVIKIYDLANEIMAARALEIQTAKLNNFLQGCIVKHPPAGLKNTHPKLRYATQTGAGPPQFTVYGSKLDFLHWSYKRFLDREMREEFGFVGTPIEFTWSNSSGKEKK